MDEDRRMEHARAKDVIHRKLYTKFNNEMMDDELNDFKILCESDIGRGKLSKLKDAAEVLRELERKGKIKAGDYEKLKKIFKSMDREQFNKYIEDAENEIRQLTNKRGKNCQKTPMCYHGLYIPYMQT